MAQNRDPHREEPRAMERTCVSLHWRKRVSARVRTRVALLLLFAAVAIYVLLAAGVVVYLVDAIFQPVSDAAAK
jgi:hypothetical protein